MQLSFIIVTCNLLYYHNKTCYIVVSVGRTLCQCLHLQLKVTKFPLSKQAVQLAGTCIGCARKVNAGRNLFSSTLPCVGLFAGQPTRGLGMLCCGAFAAADPIRNLEEGTCLGQEAHGYFFCWRLRIRCWLHNKYLFL